MHMLLPKVRVQNDGLRLCAGQHQWPDLGQPGCAAPCRGCSEGLRRENDVVMVTRLDRLARSTRDLLNILDAVGKAGAAFKSLGDAWADTTTPHGRLMLAVLGGVAEFERELI